MNEMPSLDATATVIVIDDDPSVGKSLQRLLSSAGFGVALFASADDFLKQPPAAHSAQHQPVCIVLDVHMPKLSGLELQERLLAEAYHPPIIFLTGQGSIPASVRAIKHGAVDFLEKPVEDTELLGTIERALLQDQQHYRHWQESERLQKRVNKLTARELEVLRYVIAGQLNKQIAYQLGISEKTVKVHRARAMEKLGAKSLAELVHLADKADISPLG